MVVSKNHPNITGRSIVDGMTPLSCLYHESLRRYRRREEDVMVLDSILRHGSVIFCNSTLMDLVAGRHHSQRYRTQRFNLLYSLSTLFHLDIEFIKIVMYNCRFRY